MLLRAFVPVPLDLTAVLLLACWLARAFSRRMATDKFIQLFFVLNFAALLAIIIWYAVKKGKIKTPHVNVPPPPSLSGSSAALPPAARRYLRYDHY